MQKDLFDAIVNGGPWVILAAFAMLLYREPIRDLFLKNKVDKDSDTVAGLLGTNLDLFNAVLGKLDTTNGHLDDIVGLQRDLKTEVSAQGRIAAALRSKD